MPEKVNIKEKLEQIKDHWNPRIAGEINDHEIRLVKFQGDFKFHKHEGEEEMFLVIKGSIVIDFQESQITVDEGEFIIIPKDTIHKPIAEKEAEAMLFVKSGNINTGDQTNEFTKIGLEKI